MAKKRAKREPDPWVEILERPGVDMPEEQDLFEGWIRGQAGCPEALKKGQGALALRAGAHEAEDWEQFERFAGWLLESDLLAPVRKEVREELSEEFFRPNPWCRNPGSGQLELFGGESAKLGLPGRLEPEFVYPDGCATTGADKEAARENQFRAWRSGWRPLGPPRPYLPDPSGSGENLVAYTEAVQTSPGGKGKLPKFKFVRVKRPNLDYDPDLRLFDKVIVQFSGGKDSMACLLYMIDICRGYGIDPASKIEAWHHAVDGSPYQNGAHYVWDWPITEAYCVAVCKHLQIPLHFQWRENGIMGGVWLRRGDPPHKICWEEPGGIKQCGGGIQPRDHHRLAWPRLAGPGAGRWCTPYSKIEVGEMAIRHQKRLGPKILVVTGERAEESANRATYREREVSAKLTSRTRYVEVWRPVIYWCEIEIWNMYAKYQIRPHPAYEAGFGRLSCAFCVFSSRSQIETLRSTSEAGAKAFARFAEYEHRLAEEQQATGGKGWKRSRKDCKSDFVKVIPTIHSHPIKVGRETHYVPAFLSSTDPDKPSWIDEPLAKRKRIPVSVVEEALRGVPPEIAAYHVERARRGQAVAYPAAVRAREIMEVAMGSAELPPGWSPHEPRWADPGYLPAGAFGENAGPS